MCAPVPLILGASTLLSAAQGYKANRDANKQAKRQQREQDELARTQASKRSASTSSIFDVDETEGGSDIGLGNTFLTGSQGVSNDQLNLGGTNTKLGG